MKISSYLNESHLILYENDERRDGAAYARGGGGRRYCAQAMHPDERGLRGVATFGMQSHICVYVCTYINIF